MIEFPAILAIRQTTLARILETRRIRSCEGICKLLPKWNAQYQQNPTAEEGSQLSKESGGKFGRRDELPPLASCYTILRYSVHEERNIRLQLQLQPGACFIHSEDQRTGAYIWLISLKDTTGVSRAQTHVAKEQYDYWKPESVIIEGKGIRTAINL